LLGNELRELKEEVPLKINGSYERARLKVKKHKKKSPSMTRRAAMEQDQLADERMIRISVRADSPPRKVNAITTARNSNQDLPIDLNLEKTASASPKLNKKVTRDLKTLKRLDPSNLYGLGSRNLKAYTFNSAFNNLAKTTKHKKSPFQLSLMTTYKHL
jgi:hypothetical protein